MAWTTPLFVICVITCQMQGSSALRPEDEYKMQGRANVVMSLSPKHFQHTAPEDVQQAVDRALEGATSEQKQKLSAYSDGKRSLQQVLEAISEQDKKLSQAQSESFVAKSEGEQFAAFEKETAHMQDLLQGIKALRSTHEKVSAQKRDAIHVLHDLGLEPVSSETRRASQTEGLDDALKQATQAQKDKLYDYSTARMKLQKFANDMSEQDKKLGDLESRIEKPAGIPGQSEEEKFEKLQQDTVDAMKLFEGLRSFKSAHDDFKAKQEDAIQVMQELGLRSK